MTNCWFFSPFDFCSKLHWKSLRIRQMRWSKHMFLRIRVWQCWFFLIPIYSFPKYCVVGWAHGVTLAIVLSGRDCFVRSVWLFVSDSIHLISTIISITALCPAGCVHGTCTQPGFDKTIIIPIHWLLMILIFCAAYVSAQQAGLAQVVTHARLGTPVWTAIRSYARENAALTVIALHQAFVVLACPLCEDQFFHNCF